MGRNKPWADKEGPEQGAEEPAAGQPRADAPAEPPVVASGAAEVVGALDGGAIIAVPGVGGYRLAVRTGSHEREERLADLAADPEGPTTRSATATTSAP